MERNILRELKKAGDAGALINGWPLEYSIYVCYAELNRNLNVTHKKRYNKNICVGELNWHG